MTDTPARPSPYGPVWLRWGLGVAVALLVVAVIGIQDLAAQGPSSEDEAAVAAAPTQAPATQAAPTQAPRTDEAAPTAAPSAPAQPPLVALPSAPASPPATAAPEPDTDSSEEPGQGEAEAPDLPDLPDLESEEDGIAARVVQRPAPEGAQLAVDDGVQPFFQLDLGYTTEVAGAADSVDQGADAPASSVEDAAPADLYRTAVVLEGAGADAALEAVTQAPGVQAATAVIVGEVEVAGTDQVETLRVAAVDIAPFRAFTPPITAASPDVWRRIEEGDAAFTHDVGYRMRLPLGGSAEIPAAGDDVRVGAYASNGVPPVADVMVSRDTAASWGIADDGAILVAVGEDVDPDALAGDLAELTGLTPDVIPEPEPQQALLPEPEGPGPVEDGLEFEPFTYIDNGDGTIQIDPDWVARNITREPMPIFTGEVVCHRQMMAPLRGALEEVEARGLADLIDPSQYGGCWVARHIDWNPSKPLSMHAWGLAVDFNVSTNQLGAVPQLDRRIVEIFESWGFEWGGHWRRPDGMHFEYGSPSGATIG